MTVITMTHNELVRLQVLISLASATIWWIYALALSAKCDLLHTYRNF